MPLFDQLKQKAKDFADQHRTLNPADFDDPIALKTDWHPLSDLGGMKQGLRFLNSADDRRIKFGAPIKAYAYPIFSIFLSLVLTLIALGAFSTQVWGLLFVALVLGIAFGFTGFITVRNLRIPRTFNFKDGHFYWGSAYPAPDDLPSCSLNSIYALQLIRRTGNRNSSFNGFQETNSSYRRERQVTSGQPSYQLNLVCENGSRINVVEHHQLDRLKADAAELAQKLGRPLWDIT